MSEDRREAVRMSGTVVEVSDPPPSRTTIEIEPATEHVRDVPGWCVLDVAGTRVRVQEIRRMVGESTRTHAGPWRDVAPHSGLAADLALPYRKAEVDIVELVCGDVVEIYGEVVERTQGDASYRETPPTAIRTIKGLVVARGADAEAAVVRGIAALYPPARRALAGKRPKPRTDDPRHWERPLGGLDFVFSGAFLVVAIFALVMWGTDTSPFVIGCLAAAFVLRSFDDDHRFRPRAEAGKGHSTTIQLLPVGLFAASALELHGKGFTSYWIITGVMLAWLLGVEVWLWRVFGVYRALANATPWTGDVPVTRVQVVGTVRDPTPASIDGEAVAIGRETQYLRGVGSDADTVNWVRFHADGTFLVDTKAGVVEVDPDEMIWASTVTTRADRAGTTFGISETIPISGKVCAVGSIVAGAEGMPPRLRAEGTEPAIMLATSQHGEPLGLAREMARGRIVTSVGLAVIAAAFVAVAMIHEF